jgi:peptide/nickel transport system permease protein
MDTRDKQSDPATTNAATNFMAPSLPTQGPMGAELLDTPKSVEDMNGPSGVTSIEERDLTRDADRVPAALNKQEEKSPTPFRDSMRRLARDKRAMISLGFIILFILLPIIGPVIYQHIGGPYHSTVSGQVIGPEKYHSPFWQELNRQDELPSAQYWLGTDAIGRDMFARLMQGMLISLLVALSVEVVNIALGILVGVCAGYFGSWIDQFLARLTDVLFAFPGLLFVILVAGIFGPTLDTTLSKIPVVGANGNARLLVVSIALAIVGWPLMARFVRGQSLQLKEQQFVEASRTSGASNAHIILKHIVPNLFSIVVVAATLDIANTVIGEAGLSFLGLGVQTPGSSIGLMINDAQATVSTHPWEIMVPAITLTIIVLAFSFLGDGLQAAFDPRSKD